MFNALFSRLFCAIVIVSFSFTFVHSQNVFEKVIPSELINNEAKALLVKADHYHVDVNLLVKKLNTSSTVVLNLAVGNQTKTLELEKTNILTPDYQLHTSSGESFNTAQNYAFYRGSVQDQPNSKVTLIYYNDQVAVSIYDDDGTYEINKQGDLYAGYYDHDRLEPINPDWACEVKDQTNEIQKNESTENRSSSTPECVTVFLEIDHNMYNKHGGIIANAEAWAMTIFSQLAILFMEHDVPVNISGIQVWDTTDPYVGGSNSSQVLNIFRPTVQNNPNFNGRLAHLLSGRGLGGGIAYLNQLCSNGFNVAVSGNMSSGSVSYPSYSWNVMVVTHEMGHNMGSPHTQSCTWNGNNTAIDGCGTIEGSCTDPGNPPNSVGGTIMSYCHLTSAGINLSNGFGPQPGTLIKDKYINAACTTGENCSFVAPFNDICNRAREIPVLNYCVNGFYENYATTPSNDGGSMSCGNSGIENDIWYQFEYPNVGTVNIDVAATENITDLIVEVYSGDCDNLVSIDCGFSTSGDTVSISLTGMSLVGESIFIRIVEDGSDEEGEFSLCIYSPELPCQAEVDTLINIYEDLSGASWTNNTGWADGFANGTCDYCNWYGVTCDYTGKITVLDLSNNNIQGALPEDLVSLFDLEILNLSFNNLIDTIPNYWDSLRQLRILNLSNNALIGQIPISYATMADINSIHLDYNILDDTIPVGLGYNTSLRTFTASNNLLEGCFVAGVSSFCFKDSINLSNNPGLPYSGDVALLCEFGWGSDNDQDGFCNEIQDCNDFDAAVNPDADEVLCDAVDNNCDGVIDEGSDFGPNIWIGPDTLGLFDDPTNWSLGHVPLICENIEIGSGTDTIDLILLGNDEGGEGGNGGGQSDYQNLKIRNLSIGVNTTVHLAETISLDILGNGVLVNNGNMLVAGYISIRDQENTTNTAFVNNGIFSITGFGGLYIQNIGHYGMHNTASGIMNLSGYSNIDNYGSTTAQTAVVNEGIINLELQLSISGTYLDEPVENMGGGIFDVQNGGSLSIYR